MVMRRAAVLVVMGCAFGLAVAGCAGGVQTHECDLSGKKPEQVTFTLPNLDESTLADLDIFRDVECSDGTHHVGHAVPQTVKDTAITVVCAEVAGSSTDACHFGGQKSAPHVVRETLTFTP
jgi:hypothetical protein